MGKKRKNVSNAKSGKPQQRNQLSFQDQVAQAVNNKLMATLDQRMNYLASRIMQEQQSSLHDIYSRLTTLESLCCEKFGITEDDLAILVAETEDKSMGLEEADVVENGDLVRLEVSTRTKEQEEFQGTSKTKLNNAGSGQTFGAEIEEAILGMKKDETKEIEFGKDKGMVAKLTVQRVSRAPKKEEEVKDENKDA